MTKLTGPEDAIKQAIQGGYGLNKAAIGYERYEFLQVLICTEASFWLALGKARGWGKTDRDNAAKPIWVDLYEAKAAEWFDTHLWHPEKEDEFWQQLP